MNGGWFMTLLYQHYWVKLGKFGWMFDDFQGSMLIYHRVTKLGIIKILRFISMLAINQ